uniref:Sperm-associated antigen 6 n=1 Tax=Timema monikensis TaxID=170555 RepID=A0A7R9HNY0_9NEOP|nr:unnamed protein product [Timema monikensis]
MATQCVTCGSVLMTRVTGRAILVGTGDEGFEQAVIHITAIPGNIMQIVDDIVGFLSGIGGKFLDSVRRMGGWRVGRELEGKNQQPIRERGAWSRDQFQPMRALYCRVFEQYQKARMTFVQTVSDLASRANNIEYLDSAGVLDLLRPLLSDVVPSVQHTAAVALGRLANHDEGMAQAVVHKDVLPQLLRSIDKQTKFYKKAALFTLRALGKHSPEMAHVVVQAGGLEAMVICLEDFDPTVKEAAAWAIGYVSRHNQTLSQAVVDAGAVPLLVLSLQEPELCLKQVSASALCDIAKHSLELAQVVVDAGSIPFLARSIANPDPKFKRQALSALASVAKHSVDLAELVVEAEVFPQVLIHLAHPDELVARSAAFVVREVTKHTLELCQLVVNTGGIGALIQLVSTTKSETRLPGIMSLGHMAAHSEQLAMAIIESEGVPVLALVLSTETEDHKCTNISALDPLLHEAPPDILKYIVGQFSKILPNDAKARRLFVTTGSLKRVQEIKAEPGSTLLEYITIINCCFPEDIIRYRHERHVSNPCLPVQSITRVKRQQVSNQSSVICSRSRYYSPGYPETLLDRVEQYQPELKDTALSSERRNSSDIPDLINELIGVSRPAQKGSREGYLRLRLDLTPTGYNRAKKGDRTGWNRVERNKSVKYLGGVIEAEERFLHKREVLRAGRVVLHVCKRPSIEEKCCIEHTSYPQLCLLRKRALCISETRKVEAMGMKRGAATPRYPQQTSNTTTVVPAVAFAGPQCHQHKAGLALPPTWPSSVLPRRTPPPRLWHLWRLSRREGVPRSPDTMPSLRLQTPRVGQDSCPPCSPPPGTGKTAPPSRRRSRGTRRATGPDCGSSPGRPPRMSAGRCLILDRTGVDTEEVPSSLYKQNKMELHSDCVEAVFVEMVADEPIHEAGLPHPAISQDHHLEQGVLAGLTSVSPLHGTATGTGYQGHR